MSQIIECYLHATQNEIDIDKSLSKSITKKMPPLPRTSKWAGERWSSSSLQIIYAVIMFAFIFGGFLLYVILFFAKYILAKFKNSISEIKVANNKEGKFYYFSFSDLEMRQTCYFFKDNDSYKLSRDELIIIKLPWVNYTPTSCDFNAINLYELTSFLDVARAFLLSIFSYIYYLKPSRIKWLLHIYTAPSWFLVAMGMNNIKGNLASSEHYDRWAVLTDFICRIKRKRYILIQHGSLLALKTKGYEFFSLSYKLKAVSELAIFNEIELELFLEYIISQANDYNIKIHFYQQPFYVSSINNKGLSILIIGHSLCERGQLSLGSQLSTLSDNIVLYYKEHPKARASEKAKKTKWNFITDDDYFPDVDIVISYPSTLAYQYKELNKIVILHELDNIDQNKIDEILMTIRKNKGVYGK